MNSNIQIRLIGDEEGFTSEHELTGASITYGVNTIPVAVVDLTPSEFGALPDLRDPESLGNPASIGGLSLFCALERVRRKKVVIEIRTPQGCLRFPGVIDGLSTHQTVGSIGLQLVIKSRWQVLLETFPKTPGIHPTSTPWGQRQDTINTGTTNGSYYRGLVGSTQFRLLSSLDPSQNAVAYLVKLVGLMAELQYDAEFVSALGENEGHLVIALAKKLRDPTLKQAVALFKQIDTSAVAGLQITGGNGSTHDLLLALLEDEGSWNSLYDLLIDVLDAFGCALIIGNEKAFVVPLVGFLKMPHTATRLSGPSGKVNEIHPAQYQAFNFDDQGHRDISACFVQTSSTQSHAGDMRYKGLGSYHDTEATGGVLVTALPRAISLGVASLYATLQEAGRQVVANGQPTCAKPLTAAALAPLNAASDNTVRKEFIKLQQDFLNNWAQIKYLQAKYGDRTGSYSSVFNPKVCPGVVGTLLSRYPATYIDHMVTGVRHTFRLSPPSGGQADTVVQFNCGRLSKAGKSTGVDSAKLYGYSAKEAAAVAELFVKDVTLQKTKPKTTPAEASVSEPPGSPPAFG